MNPVLFNADKLPWCERLPRRWRMTRLKHAASIRFSGVDKHTVEGEISVRLCNYVDVYRNERVTPSMQFMNASASPEEIRRFAVRAGDVLITKDSESWKDIAVPALAVGEFDGVLCGYHLAMIRPDPRELDSRFLARAFQAVGIREQFHIEAKGITRFGLSGDSVASAVFPLPPLAEQRAIADFLDRETARVDLVAERHSHLLRLQESIKRRTVTEAVQGRLTESGKTRSSSISWIGEVPELWKVVRLKHVCVSIKDGTHNPPERASGFHRLLSVRNMVDGGFVLLDDDRTMTPDQFALLQRSYTVRKGDVLLAIVGATTGKSAIMPALENVTVQRSVAILRPDPAKVLPEFLHCCLQSDIIQTPIAMAFDEYSAQPGIYLNDLGELRIPLPSIESQTRIVEAVSRVFERVKAISDLIRRQENLLQEYRSALITSAVTGQNDVPHAVSRSP